MMMTVDGMKMLGYWLLASELMYSSVALRGVLSLKTPNHSGLAPRRHSLIPTNGEKKGKRLNHHCEQATTTRASLLAAATAAFLFAVPQAQAAPEWALTEPQRIVAETWRVKPTSLLLANSCLHNPTC